MVESVLIDIIKHPYPVILMGDKGLFVGAWSNLKEYTHWKKTNAKRFEDFDVILNLAEEMIKIKENWGEKSEKFCL